MKLKNKNMLIKSEKSSLSIALYAAASTVAVLGIALLIDNIFIFKKTVDQYVSQGYPSATVIKQLLPSQLLPGIFEPIALYGGIAFILLGLAIVNKKVSKYLAAVDKNEVYDDINVNNNEESASKQNIIETENMEIAEQIEVIENMEETKKNDNND
ncbi:hypothetical protein I6U48_11145 [Clostridium sp. PL3]|uniref:Uncharacterized protein n=1 Tax=Clostridium thailandense TaxID=2794346 RepID=A0A949TZJ5_9CLOT|nr:hypothetical protein [Clostridium thailandense]MBV7273464.1 hypothetical protein [Clostridium thailandense]